MREAQAMTSLYVRIESSTDMAMRNTIRTSPSKYRNVSEFVRAAINNQLKRERSRTRGDISSSG